jgi:plastocyanin
VSKIRIGFIAMLLVSSACMGGAGNERSVFVDYSHDEFSSFMIGNFPKHVSVAAGDSVVFKQIWTGEPHTVTGGTLVNKMMKEVVHWEPFFMAYEALLATGIDLPNPEAPRGSWADAIKAVEDSKAGALRTQLLDAYDGIVTGGSKLPARGKIGDLTAEDAIATIDKESEAVFESTGLPWALDETKDGDSFVSQNAGQPCFLNKGAPPKKNACTTKQQVQPAFDGTASYFNSGVIPYEGPQGNTFKVDFSAETDPGSYFFYCAVHGPGQFTEVKVKPAGSDIPSQEVVSREARKEIKTFAAPMLKAYRDAQDGKLELEGNTIEGPFAGLTSAAHGSVNEFVPDDLKVKVNEPVTWKIMGSDHSISFDVPEYFPVITFAKNGKVSLNPKLEPPAGGSPPLPDDPGEGGPPQGGGPAPITKVDGGTYDGDGFFSSGLFGGEPYAEYTLRFSKAGTYKYACLLHPPMVGTVEVT